jgi:hypothetical protein
MSKALKFICQILVSRNYRCRRNTVLWVFGKIDLINSLSKRRKNGKNLGNNYWLKENNRMIMHSMRIN